MKAAVWVSGVAAFFLLLVAGMIRQGDTRELTATSFGCVPAGHRALYEVLVEAGLPVGRSFALPEQLPPQRTIWWIEPDLAEEEGGGRPSPLRGEALRVWIEEGGRAIVLLGKPSSDRIVLAGLAVPGRQADGSEFDLGQTPNVHELQAERAPVEGPLAPRLRILELPGPRGFVQVDPLGWRTVATLAGEPFVLERTLGEGRLVIVADARFLSNGWLDRADAAPFMLDLVRAYGVPWIDEHEHGFVASRGALGYLAGSPALPFFLGLALLGMGFAWFGASLPSRRVRESDASTPTLETYVTSLAGLYATTRDNARVLDRYRELTARRLRRLFGLPPDASLQSLTERLARRRSLGAEGLALLTSGTRTPGGWELERAVALLDQLVREARA